MYNNGAVARKSFYDAFSALYCYCLGMEYIYTSEYCPEHEHHMDDYNRCFNQTSDILKELKYFLGYEAGNLASSLLGEHRSFFEPLNYRFQLKKSSGGSPNVQASPDDNYSAQLARQECKTQIANLNMSTQKLLQLLVGV
jgi:hypothetical protein